MTAAPLIAGLAWCVFASAQAPQPPRDAPRTTPVGTASISGVVVLDAAEVRPIRRARVILNSAELQIGRTVVSEDDGTFTFGALPAGRYTVGAAKEGYVTSNLGATRPGRPGTPVVVADAERKRVTLRMPRGAVISGTVLDVDGNPAQGFPVRAMRHGFLNGERQQIPAGNAAITDDRGNYRIYGLQAGDYIVTGSPRGTAYTSGEVQVMTAAALRAARDDVRGATGAQARPGVTESSMAADGGETLRSSGYTTVYYPGVTVATEAATVTLRQSEERTGIDFQAQLVPMARVSGTIAATEGAASPTSMINLVSTASGGSLLAEGVRFARPTPDGAFAFTGVPPGRYSIMARGTPAGAPPVAAGGRDMQTPPLWAIADVVVDGSDVTDVALTLQAGFTLTGRLAFEGTRPPPPDLSRARVQLQAVQRAGEMTMMASPGRVDAEGQFTIDGIMPGRYRLSATLAGRPSNESGWWLSSSVVNGQETLDAPLDLRESLSGAVVTFSERTTEVSGTARTSAAEPTPDCFVIAAPVDRAAWAPQSRRLIGVRPSSEGKYTIKNLPPGEYLIAAVVDAEPGEWFDPRFLELALQGATRITLAEAERKTQDVVVR